MSTTQEGKVVVTGSLGQIGAELVPLLRKIYGKDNVIALGNKTKPSEEFLMSGPFEIADICDKNAMEAIVKKYNVKIMYHLASLLSAVSESSPDLAWNINVQGLKNILDLARDYKFAVFWPSSIGAFGPTTPKVDTPQHTLLEPTSMYGVTKVSGELLCSYYHKKWNVDVRGLRYPGIISSEALPGGGTTDYAVDIYYQALQKQSYTCYLRSDSVLPMMYMPDALQAAIDLMNSPTAKKGVCYNVTAFSFDPSTLFGSIKTVIPEMKMEYNVDPLRQGIADSWPDTIDDSEARKDWNWSPKYSLEGMTKDMLEKLKQKLKL